MHVNLYATFRIHAGIKSFDIELPEGSTVHQAVLEIVRRYPVLRSHWLDAADSVHAHVHIFVNSAEVGTLPQKLDTLLSTSDTLDFFPPVAGGAI